MYVAIVNHHDFRSNSGIHIFNLANRLVARGIDVVAYVPGEPSTVSGLGEAHFEVRPTTDPSPSRVDLVHAWTPRQEVRPVAQTLVERHRAPYVVHLEDNEDIVATHAAGLPPDRVRRLTRAQLSGLVRTLPRSSRLHYQRFLEAADGVTVVIERLLEFAPAGVPRAVVWPGYEPELFRSTEPDRELRRTLGIDDREQTVVYAGNVHSANADEVRALYLAVGLVNTRGTPLRLVRLGDDHVDFLGPGAHEVLRYEVRVPYVEREAVPRYFALADVLVQPGAPGPFNDYRFPSKVPEFLAMGKPVILPATNIGLELRDGEEAVLLRRGDALELALTISRVLGDSTLREKVSAGGRRFAETRLSWERSADRVAQLYAEVIGGRRRR